MPTPIDHRLILRSPLLCNVERCAPDSFTPLNKPPNRPNIEALAICVRFINCTQPKTAVLVLTRKLRKQTRAHVRMHCAATGLAKPNLNSGDGCVAFLVRSTRRSRVVHPETQTGRGRIWAVRPHPHHSGRPVCGARGMGQIFIW